jgi:hypothetical protein
LLFEKLIFAMLQTNVALDSATNSPFLFSGFYFHDFDFWRGKGREGGWGGGEGSKTSLSVPVLSKARLGRRYGVFPPEGESEWAA